MDGPRQELLSCVQKLIRLRRDHPVFRHKKFFGDVRSGIRQACFYNDAGGEINVFNWEQPYINSFALLLRGDAIWDVQANGNPIEDDSFLLLFNGNFNPVDFRLPPSGLSWEPAMRTDRITRPHARYEAATGGMMLHLEGRSFVLLCSKRIGSPAPVPAPKTGNVVKAKKHVPDKPVVPRKPRSAKPHARRKVTHRAASRPALKPKPENRKGRTKSPNPRRIKKSSHPDNRSISRVT